MKIKAALGGIALAGAIAVSSWYIGRTTAAHVQAPTQNPPVSQEKVVPPPSAFGETELKAAVLDQNPHPVLTQAADENVLSNKPAGLIDIKAMRVAALRRNYGWLLSRIKLSPAAEDKFLDLINTKSQIVTNSNKRLKNGEFKSKEEGVAWARDQMIKVNSEIASAIGRENWGLYTEANDRLATEYKTMNNFPVIAKGDLIPLSANQEEAMRDAYYQEYKSAGINVYKNVGEGSVMPVSEFTAELTKRHNANQAVYNRLRFTLTDKQLALLKQYDQQTLADQSKIAVARLAKAEKPQVK